MMGLSLLAVQCKSSQPESIAVSPLVVYPPVIQLLNLIVTLTIILTLVRKLSTQQLKPQRFWSLETKQLWVWSTCPDSHKEKQQPKKVFKDVLGVLSRLLLFYTTLLFCNFARQEYHVLLLNYNEMGFFYHLHVSSHFPFSCNCVI